MGRFHNIQASAQDRRPGERSLTLPGALNIVLFQPRIPQNTGSIARLCAATGCRLDLINPFFKIDDSKLRRAGLDYWHLLDVGIHSSFEQWLETRAQGEIPWLVEVGAPQSYTQVSFAPTQAVMFGDEQEGIPQSLLDKYPEKHIGLPQQGVRSLNLAMCAGIVSYEALRQIQWLK